MVLEPPGLDPTTAPAAAIGEVTHYNIFEGLTKINEDFSVTPLLAENWTFSPDLKTLTFSLKPNVKFQDGEPFSAKDVKFSFERFGAKDSTNKDKGFFASIESIETPDPHDRRAPLQGPELRGAVSSRHEHRRHPRRKERRDRSDRAGRHGPLQARLSGPRAPRSRSTSGTAIATRRRFRSRARPSASSPIRRPRRRRCSPATSTPSRASPTSRRSDQFKSDPRFQVLIGGTEGKTILAINNKKKPLDDLKVRQAISYAIDRKAIIDGAMNGLGAPIGSHLTPNDPGYVDLTGLYPHDPDKAKALLKEAGVTTPLDLTLILPPPAYARQGGQIIAAELADVGINAKIQNVEWAQWLSGVYKDHNYDLTIISHVEPLDIGIYANPNYYYQYDSPAFQAIDKKITTAPNLEAYKAALGEAQKQFAADAVNAYLFQLPNVTVANADLQGLWKNAPIFVNDLSALSWK